MVIGWGLGPLIPIKHTDIAVVRSVSIDKIKSVLPQLFRSLQKALGGLGALDYGVEDSVKDLIPLPIIQM